MTTIASGIGSQVGVAKETTYGTYVAPSEFIQATKVGLKKVKNIAQGDGLAAGRLMQLGSRRVPTTKAGTGTIDLDVVNRNMGLLIQALMGTSVTPVQQAASTAYLQTHTLADTSGKFLSIQAGVPDLTGTARPYSFVGSKVTAAAFTFELAKQVTATFTVDARDVDEAQTLAAASYVTGTRPFVGTDTTVKVGTYGSEASVDGVTKATVNIDRSLKTDRFYFGNAGLKSEPVISGWAKVTGTISADYVDKTIWADRFAADTGFSLVLEAVGAVVDSTYHDTFRITLPECYLDGDTPMVQGPDVVNGDFPFTCLFDETNLPKIEIISADSTL